MIALAVAAALAVATTEVDVQAELDPDEGELRGSFVLRQDNATAEPLGRAYLWLYPNRHRVRPPVDDVDFYWTYPREFDPGWMRLGTVRQKTALGWKPARARPVAHARAGDGVLVELELPAAVPAGGTIELAAGYLAKIPERYGGFGCVSRECTLAGGWSPMPVRLDAAGWDLSALAPARWRGHLASPGDVWIEGDATHDFDVLATHVVVRVYRKAYVTRRVRRGVELVHVSQTPPPPADDAARATLSYSEESWSALVLGTAEEAVDTLAEAGAPMPRGTRLVFAEAPLRQELALAHPGVVLVSDRLFRIFPAERFRKFHARELVRGLYTTYFAGRPHPGREARDAEVEPDVAAAYLTDLFTIRQYEQQEFAQNVLAPVAFVPAVDQLIYAPQVAFAGAYFGGIADTDELRDDVRRFSHGRPRGSVYYEKLRDLLDPEDFGEAMRPVVLGRARVRDAAEEASGQDLAAFFRQWGGRYPRVDYRYAGSTRRVVPDGWEHTIVVEKVATGREAAPVEPVEVAVVDAGGKKHALRWDGRGARGELKLVSSSDELDVVSVDPRARLVEFVDGPADPRFDDRRPARWKFLYNSFGVLADSQGNLSAAADFSFRRIHDNESALRFQLFTTESVLVGGSAGYSRRFGGKIAANRPLASLGLSLGVQRLTEAYGPGTRLSLSLAGGADDRLIGFETLRARGLSAGVRWTMTRFDEGAAGENVGDEDAGQFLHTAVASADYTRIVTPIDGHTLVGNLEGAVVGGDIRRQAQLLAAGGAGGLRGYGPGELYGRLRLGAHGEWRASLSHDLNVNFGHFAWLRSAQLVGFADAAMISSCDGYGLGADDLYANLGLGLRFFYDNFGVQPGMTGLDVAVPLVVRARRCLDDDQPVYPSRPPVFVYLTFIPPY